MGFLRRNKLHNEIIINDSYVFYVNHAVGMLLINSDMLKVGDDANGRIGI